MKSSDPYAAGKLAASPYAARTAVTGSLVAVLRGTMADRGLELIKPPSRCVRKYEVHELILTDDCEAGPGRRVDSIAYLGFAEFAGGGVLVSGDVVFLDGEKLGVLAGFDETHAPNHLNVVVRADRLADGVARGARPGAAVRFAARDEPEAGTGQGAAAPAVRKSDGKDGISH